MVGEGFMAQTTTSTTVPSSFVDFLNTLEMKETEAPYGEKRICRILESPHGISDYQETCFLLDAAWVSRLPRNKHTDHVTMFDLGFFRSNLSCAKKWCLKVHQSTWWELRVVIPVFRSSLLPFCATPGCVYLFRWFFIINIHVPTDWCGSSAWKVPWFFRRPSSWETADDCASWPIKTQVNGKEGLSWSDLSDDWASCTLKYVVCIQDKWCM